MDSTVLYLVYTITVTVIFSTVSKAQPEGTCKACNCQLNNVEVLDRLIESKIASGKLAKLKLLSYYVRKLCKFVKMGLSRNSYSYILAFQAL